MMNEMDIYFGEVLMNNDVCDGDSVLVMLGGNASPAMWSKFAETLQQKGAVALCMKVKRHERKPEQSTQDTGVFAERALELAETLMGNAQEEA